MEIIGKVKIIDKRVGHMPQYEEEVYMENGEYFISISGRMTSSGYITWLYSVNDFKRQNGAIVVPGSDIPSPKKKEKIRKNKQWYELDFIEV